MKSQIELPPFQGKPVANLLEGDFGRAVLDEYRQRAKKQYHGAYPLNCLSFCDNIVQGSNPYAAVLVNQIVREKGLRTATPSDLEKIFRTDSLDMTEYNIDTAKRVVNLDGEIMTWGDYLKKRRSKKN